MYIRKSFRFEAAHIVRNCHTRRCSHNIHGHSYTVDILIYATELDRAGMVLDFGLLKNTVGALIDGFDHSLMVHTADEQAVRIAEETNERIVYSPLNLSAENMALLIFAATMRILNHTIPEQEIIERGISVQSVIVHETTTGYACCEYDDIPAEWDHLTLDFSDACLLDNEHLLHLQNSIGSKRQLELPFGDAT